MANDYDDITPKIRIIETNIQVMNNAIFITRDAEAENRLKARIAEEEENLKDLKKQYPEYFV